MLTSRIRWTLVSVSILWPIVGPGCGPADSGSIDLKKTEAPVESPEKTRAFRPGDLEER